MADTKDRHHEETGAAILDQFFPPIVTDCVRHHVAAKRCLCATDPAYLHELSLASIHSLNLQGGAMGASEVAEFERNPNVEAISRVRRYHDAGKVTRLETKSFADYAPMVQRVVDAHCRGG